MPKRTTSKLMHAAVSLTLTAQIYAAPLEEPAKVAAPAKVEIEEFTGSLGATAMASLRSHLLATDDFIIQPGPQSFKIQAYASGGKIKGTLLDPSGKVLFSETYSNPNLRLNVLQFSDEIQSVIFGHPGVGMTQIAFVSDASGHKEIYVCDADGFNIRQITNDQSICVSPSLRNDAVFLAFTSYVSGYPDIYMIDLRNNGRRRIVNAPGTNSGAAFSPDGERLAMTMSFVGNPELYVTNPGGHGGRRLTNSSWTESSPAWSPDGKRIAYVANPNGKPQLFTIASSGGPPSPIALTYQYVGKPNWSPDGVHIAATVRQSGKLSVAITNLSKGGTRLVGPGSDPCWGADGRHLLYVHNNSLVILHVEKETKKTIISNMGKVSQPTWSR